MTIIGTAAWRTGAALVSMLGAATLAMACDGSEGASGRVADSGTDAAIDAADASTADTPLDGAVPEGYRLIEGGTFTIGSPPTERGRDESENQEVRTVSSFFLKAHEVTQGEWVDARFFNPSSFEACGRSCPVNGVNWWEALHFANHRSAADGLPVCYLLTDCGDNWVGLDRSCRGLALQDGASSPVACTGFRLPTEAEWEYAYRAGTTTAFHNGGIVESDHIDPNLERIAWYAQNSEHQVRPVGGKSPNAWDLYDMSGNVWEWTWDLHSHLHDSGTPADWGGPDEGTHRVLRGGGYNSRPREARAASRARYSPGNARNDIGFRLARTAPPSSTPRPGE